MFVFAILITFTFILIISFIPVLVLQLYYTISYGLIWAEYMWEHRAHEYRMMLQDGTWNRYLHEVDEECRREVEQTVRRIMEKEGVDERLKAEKPLEWVKRVNGIKMCVEAEVERELCV